MVGAGDYSHDRFGQEEIDAVGYVLLEAAGGGSTVCHHNRRRAELLLARQPGTDHHGLSLQPMTGRLATRPSNTAVKIQMASCNDSVAGPFGNADTGVPWRER